MEWEERGANQRGQLPVRRQPPPTSQQPKHRKARPFLKCPTHWHGELVAKAVLEKELLVHRAVFVHEARDLHIVAAILSDIEETALAKPVNGLHAFAGFLNSKRSGGDRVEGQTMLQFVLQLDQHVERGKLAQIEDGII